MKQQFTFVVCAYKDSPYLEAAVLSALQQSVPVEVIIATSTPSDYIAGIAAKYNIPCFINTARKGIAADWNFALKQVRTPYAAILHQDDIYFRNYAEKIIAGFKKNTDALIAFTDYCDLMDDGKFHPYRLYLQIKRLLLWAFYLKNSHRSFLFKSSAVSLGNAICCPAVSYNMGMINETAFDTSFSVNLDWAKWIELTKRKGAFVFIPKILMAHRIADSMETASAIADNRRYEEDFRIFSSIWGEKIATFLMKFYKKAYSSNSGKA